MPDETTPSSFGSSDGGSGRPGVPNGQVRAGGFGNGSGGFGNNNPATFERRSVIGKLFDKVAPHSVEAEMGLLGSMILDPRVVADVMAIIKDGSSFYLPAHARIYEGITKTVDSKGTVDPLMLLEKLRDEGVLEQCGGPAYIEKLAVEVPTAVNAPHFAQVVADKHKLRRLIDAAGDILFKTYNAQVTDTGEVKKLIDEAEQAIFNIAQAESISDIQGLDQLLVAEFNRLIAIEEGRIVDTGVMTGFHDLDRDTTGFHGGEMIILAARPSMGKTAFVLNMAEQIALGTDTAGSSRAVRAKVPIGIFSLEMSRDSLAQRLLSSWSGVSSQKIRSGQISHSATNNEHQELLQAANVLMHAPIYIDDTPGLTIMGMRARARRMVTQYKCKLIMIDYLQLLSSPAAARESRQAEVGQISRGIKELARELKIPIIALSQLNRNSEGRENNRPRISDLRESGSIEQDADMVMLLHREEYYHIGDESWMNDPNNADKIGVAELIIAKQRNGPTGTVKLTWDASRTRFNNFTPGGGGEMYIPPPRPGQFDTPPGADAYGYNAYTTPSGGPGTSGGFPDDESPFEPSDGVAGTDAGGQADSPPAAPPGPRPGGFFHPGKRSGPVDGHRDGGGPDRDEGKGAREPEPGRHNDAGSTDEAGGPSGPGNNRPLPRGDDFAGDDVAPF